MYSSGEMPILSSRVKTAVLGALALAIAAVSAQEIEPRAFSNAPVGVNFLIAGYAYTRGGLAFDSSALLTSPDLTTSSAVLGYARVLDLWGMSGKVDAVVPYTWLSGSADYSGDPVERIVNGFADPRLRFSINFYGGPAPRLDELRSYPQDLIIGGSIQVSAPWGQYDPSRLVNIGTNRWSVKPELGLSQALGRWTLEASAAATLLADHDNFFGGKRRSQDPLYSAQARAIYRFDQGIWGSLDAIYFSGGRTEVNDTPDDSRQRNWRLGATLALPVDAHRSIKLYARSGVSARTGNNFDLVGIAWQHRWGGGL